MLLASTIVHKSCLGTYLTTKISKVAIYVHKMKMRIKPCRHSVAWVPLHAFIVPSGAVGGRLWLRTPCGYTSLRNQSLSFACTACPL